MDANTELVAEHRCRFGQDLEIDMRGKGPFDPSDLRVRNPDECPESTGADAGSDARDPKLFSDATKKEAGATAAALDGRLAGWHSPTMASRTHPAIGGRLRAAHLHLEHDLFRPAKRRPKGD